MKANICNPLASLSTRNQTSPKKESPSTPLDDVAYFIYDKLGLDKILSGDRLLKEEFKITCTETIKNPQVSENKKTLYRHYLQLISDTL